MKHESSGAGSARVTNRKFAETDLLFQAARKAAGLPFERNGQKSTKQQIPNGLARQAGKWRNGKGLARKYAV